MTLWCHGSQTFHQSLAGVASSTPIDETSDPGAGDQLLLDLDAGELRQLSDRMARWLERGCTVIVACQPKALNLAVEAVRNGAAKILLKPVDPDELLAALGHEAGRPSSCPETGEDIAAWRAAYAPEIIGESSTLNDAMEIAARAAECDCPVLITGENGTGKELLAQAIHRASSRASAPFIPVNCPAIPKELVESELFGHAKGAFTGATMARVGRFAAADNGTLLLDEIGEMDLSIQSKLLRVLQDYQITRVGDSRPQRVNVRVIAATNRDLEEMASSGTFREDLFYRLNVLQIHLPALRERREDIPILIDHFLQSISKQRKVPVPTLTERAREALVAYDWPGNIRQLRNIIERLVILQRGETVDLKHLPLCVTRHVQQQQHEPEATGDDQDLFGALHLPPDGIDLRDALQRFEDTMIHQALLTTGGNKNQAAKILGLNRTTLVEKLRKRNVAAV